MVARVIERHAGGTFQYRTPVNGKFVNDSLLIKAAAGLDGDFKGHFSVRLSRILPVALKLFSDSDVNSLCDEKKMSKNMSCLSELSTLDKSSQTTLDPRGEFSISGFFPQ
ncbi:hypothetical protein TNCV_4597781 [Trichonephila clavipes]|nr:hypothetical protein TNCV_4597781 [Trichonephila clavipes]